MTTCLGCGARLGARDAQCSECGTKHREPRGRRPAAAPDARPATSALRALRARLGH